MLLIRTRRQGIMCQEINKTKDVLFGVYVSASQES